MLEPRMFSRLPGTPGTTSEQPAPAVPELKTKPTRLHRYGVAVGAVLIAFFLRLVLFGELDNRLPFAFFLPAAIVAAWYGGLGPGLLAAAAGLLLGDYFFLPPHHALGPLGAAERTSIVVFAGTSTLAVVLIGNLHARIRSLESQFTPQAGGVQPDASAAASADRDAAR